MSPLPAQKKKTNKRSEVLNSLRKRIVDGDYPQGVKLIEQDLAKQFGVSRPVLREVLTDLESQGLVEKVPNKGTMVRRVSSESLLEIMEVREVLEGLAARLAAQKSKPEDWRDLVDRFGEPCEKMVENLEFDNFLGLVALFRQRMVTLASNEELSKQIYSLFAKITIVQRRVVILPAGCSRPSTNTGRSWTPWWRATRTRPRP